MASESATPGSPRPAGTGDIELLDLPANAVNALVPMEAVVAHARYTAPRAGGVAESTTCGGTDPRILVWTEIDPDDQPPDTDLDLALRSLELPYEVVYGGGILQLFIPLLQSEDWDLVIFDHAVLELLPSEFVVYDALLDYVQSGGRLVVGSWQIADVAEHPLWAELGIVWQSDFQLPKPVLWSDLDPLFFSVPNDVPEFVSLGEFYVIDGAEVETLPGSEILAFYDPIDLAQGVSPALVRANEGRMLYRAFVDGRERRESRRGPPPRHDRVVAERDHPDAR